MKTTLPTDSNARKDIPLYSGCYTYFPAALAGVAKHSKMGNDKHNPGEPLHHARGKSMDHADTIARHSMDLADMLAAVDRNNGRVDKAWALLAEANALCWRALAWSQELHERFAGAPLAPAARLPENPLAERVNQIVAETEKIRPLTEDQKKYAIRAATRYLSKQTYRQLSEPTGWEPSYYGSAQVPSAAQPDCPPSAETPRPSAHGDDVRRTSTLAKAQADEADLRRRAGFPDPP